MTAESAGEGLEGEISRKNRSSRRLPGEDLRATGFPSGIERVYPISLRRIRVAEVSVLELLNIGSGKFETVFSGDNDEAKDNQITVVGKEVKEIG